MLENADYGRGRHPCAGRRSRPPRRAALEPPAGHAPPRRRSPPSVPARPRPRAVPARRRETPSRLGIPLSRRPSHSGAGSDPDRDGGSEPLRDGDPAIHRAAGARVRHARTGSRPTSGRRCAPLTARRPGTPAGLRCLACSAATRGEYDGLMSHHRHGLFQQSAEASFLSVSRVGGDPGDGQLVGRCAQDQGLGEPAPGAELPLVGDHRRAAAVPIPGPGPGQVGLAVDRSPQTERPRYPPPVRAVTRPDS